MKEYNKLIEVDFKDNSPMGTVEVIRKILEKHNIKTEEEWIESAVPNCYTVRLKLDGTNFGTSGKGLTRELALASAYGEFMERVQLGFFGRKSASKDGLFSMNDSQDIKISKDQLSEDDLSIYQKQAEYLYKWNGTEISPEENLMQYVDSEGQITVTPFISLVSGKTVYVPSKMRKAVLTSTGCAAGNSLEEAMVQALSEIVERHYNLRIIRENFSSPEIPEEKLKEYSVAYDIIEYIRSKGYKVIVKDCSLGNKFPVVCVCIIQTSTGKYHSHFGAAPVFEIALTRAITEAFQGRNIDSVAKFDDFVYSKNEEEFISNVSREIIYGTSMRMPEFFDSNFKYEYNPNVGFNGKNNKEILKECISFFAEQGYDVLVRNASALGFPTCQILIPGYSETFIHRISKKTHEKRYLSYAVNAFRDLSKASIDDMMGALLHHKNLGKIMGPQLKNKSSFLANSKIIANISRKEEEFLMAASMAYIFYALEQKKEIKKYLDQMVALNDGTKEEFLLCLKKYFGLIRSGYEEEKIKDILSFLHTSETVDKLYGYINENKNPFEEFILRCDMKCGDDCILKGKCCLKRVKEVATVIEEETRKLDFDEFSNTVRELVK